MACVYRVKEDCLFLIVEQVGSIQFAQFCDEVHTHYIYLVTQFVKR